MWLCVCVCLFSIEIQTAGQIGMKFGTEVVLKDLVGVGYSIGPQIQIWKDLGLDSFSRGVYKIKVVVHVPYSAWTQGQGIGLEALEGQCLAIPIYFIYPTKPYNLNTIFKTYFESSRAMLGNPS